MGLETAAAKWAFGAFVLGTASSVQQIKQSKRATRARNKLTELRNLRQKKESIRKARAARAEIEAQEVTSGAGTGTTSAAAGARGSVQAQLGFNLSFLDTAASLSTTVTGAQSKAATSQAIAGLSQTIFQGAGGYESIFEKTE